MSERYGKLFSLPENLYTEGSPVIIAAGALLKDNQTGKVLAQLKIQNITPKKIKAATVCIQPLDTVGNPLGDTVTYQYLDLCADRDSEFGQKTPIALPNAATRSFQAFVTEVIFADNTTWTQEIHPWESLKRVQTLSVLQDGELEKQFRMDYGWDCANLLLEQKDLWHCVCGAVNRQGEANCHKCRKSHADLKAIDMDSLRARKAERLAQEKADAEAAQLEAQKQAKIFKKIAIRVGIIAACIAVVVIAVMLISDMIAYNSAVSLMNAGKYEEAIAAFEAMDGCRDSAEQIIACETAIIDEAYNSAVSLMVSGNIVEAYEALIALDGYKDSSDKASSIFDAYKLTKLKNAQVGDCVFFGAYEQDNNTANGKENIEWQVLDIKDGKVLVLSKYALDCKPYNTEQDDVTWETCSLRQWMNKDFINAAFSTEEQTMLSTVTVSADKNPNYSTVPGNATQDKIFLLSISEVNQYLTSNSAKQCIPTDYAANNGAYVDPNSGTCSWWWLRSPGWQQSNAVGIVDDHGVFWEGIYVDCNYGAVRPAMWITLNA